MFIAEHCILANAIMLPPKHKFLSVSFWAVFCDIQYRKHLFKVIPLK